MIGIRMAGLPDLGIPGRLQALLNELVGEMNGAWLAHLDLEGKDGRGEMLWTNNPRQALAFPDIPAAVRAYESMVSERPPLTNFQVSFDVIPHPTPAQITQAVLGGANPNDN